MRKTSLLFLHAVGFFILGLAALEISAHERGISQISRGVEVDSIFQLKVKIGSQRDMEILRRIALEHHPGGSVADFQLSRGEVICKATARQMNDLSEAGIKFEVENTGVEIRKRTLADGSCDQGKGNCYGQNPYPYSIPEGDWTSSPITITSAPPGATVTSIDVYYEVIHPYIGDLVIDLTDQDVTHQWNLWYYEGGSGDNIAEAEFDITVFNGELVNQTWKLWGWDCCAGNNGYIDYWSIQIWYQDLPDLIVQSLTASDYSPDVGEEIDITVVIKNQGVLPAYGSFYTGLYYDLAEPPNVETIEDRCELAWDLDTNHTVTLVFENVTSYEAGTWHMYALADCEDQISENNEGNNYKGPVAINWIQPPPDLVVQSLTVDDPSLVITEHTNGRITIRNQGAGPAMDCFSAGVFKNRSSPPTPPATGEYNFTSYGLDAGETICWDFYKLPHSTDAGTWSMWGLVDSYAEVVESNESNNRYGPVTITWEGPPSLQDVPRSTMIAHALEFVNVDWTCSQENATPHWTCPTWTCAFYPGQQVTGEAYSWGGWDQPMTHFLTYLSGGLCAGSRPSNNCSAVDAYWAAGTDCSGLVSRCWELPSRHITTSLVGVSQQIAAPTLLRGDVMNKPGSHVMMFLEWFTPCTTMTVVEAVPNQCRIWNYDVQALLDSGYVPRRYLHATDPDNHDPVIEGHLECRYPADDCGSCLKPWREVTLEISASDEDTTDAIYYYWLCYHDMGYFLPNGLDTISTTDNFVTYVTPDIPWDYKLWVYVFDNRGGSDYLESNFEVYDYEYSCLCGDAHLDGCVECGDAIYIINYLYRGGNPPPDPILRADVNNDCIVDVGDAVYILNYLFYAGPAPECCWFPPE